VSQLSYTPTFRHTPWVDNVSRVKAGGPDGFNVRFEAIDSDLHQVSTVVATINTLLDSAGPAQSGTQRLLVPLSPTHELIPGSQVWAADNIGAIHPEPDSASAAKIAASTMDLSLPDQATLVSMRVIGAYQSASANISIGIQRNHLSNIGISADSLVRINITPPGPGNPYDITMPVTAFAAVDNNNFRYALTFGATGVADADTLRITVDSVEIFYTLG